MLFLHTQKVYNKENNNTIMVFKIKRFVKAIIGGASIIVVPAIYFVITREFIGVIILFCICAILSIYLVKDYPVAPR